MTRIAPSPLLTDLEVLVVDCQTTGATPARGHLLEVAWASLGAGLASPPTVHARLTALPGGARLPPRIAQITGISERDLEGAGSAEAAWHALLESGAQTRPTLAVAHFARFERAFFEALHATGDDKDAPFPLTFLCTHEIACRLLPGLPRRGLRALAGRLGHVLGETQRAAAHVEATLCVWRELVRMLGEKEDVHTLDAFHAWYEGTKPARRGGRDHAVSRAFRLDLPDAPGVYRMVARGGEALYLGKATSLRRRVNGYFQKRRHARGRIPEMLTQVHDIQVTPTETPLEAALLEADEIKRLEPPYNVQLRERRSGILFANPTLTSLSPRADAHHRMGPFPGPESVEGIQDLRALLHPEGDLPDEDPLARGRQLFCERHGLRLGTPAPLPLSRLVGLGARLFKRQRFEEADPDEGAEDEPGSPEEAADALDDAVRRFAHERRRARFLLQLSESSLLWAPPGRDAWRRIVLEHGRVVRAEDAPAGSLPGAPPGWPRSRTLRLASLDPATTSRLRVFLAEIRRIVQSGAAVHLAFDPRRTLDRQQLARRLFWV